MKVFEQNIQYTFKDKSLLNLALTHSSYANESKSHIAYNERLEFLGDAVLQLVTSEKLYKENPHMPEGKMSKTRAALVCEDALANYSHKIDLGSFMFLGKGEENTGGRERPSILADAFEALIGAIFLDGGIAQAKKFILRFLNDTELHLQDYKTLLQEIIQQNPGERLSYIVVKEEGPDHDKSFTVEVHLNSNPIGSGEGKSKKQAEQQAAKEALGLMGYHFR
ncbi:MAG: ribonuclease III [Oscillospiraceae bacterium]|nr:ribonuclease III [Oscillospiraceae bacterium]